MAWKSTPLNVTAGMSPSVTPRWVRERKRFDKGAITRVEENQADLFKYVNYIHQDTLDIEKQIRYLEYVMFEIDERRNK